MPLKQLHVVKKIKYLVSSIMITKKQIVDEVEKNAKEHRVINKRQEKEDDLRVDHALTELREENKITNDANSHVSLALIISVFVNIIFLIIFVLVWLFSF